MFDEFTYESDVLYLMRQLVFAYRTNNIITVKTITRKIKHMEDALAIYRLQRQPHRTSNLIDVEKYKPGKNTLTFSSIMNKFKKKNKVTYERSKIYPRRTQKHARC